MRTVWTTAPHALLPAKLVIDHMVDNLNAKVIEHDYVHAPYQFWFEFGSTRVVFYPNDGERFDVLGFAGEPNTTHHLWTAQFTPATPSEAVLALINACV